MGRDHACDYWRLTATTGSIGGWTIGATDLQGSGGVIGLASSGSIRMWSGSATPSAAPFRVDSLGNLTSTAGSIGGWTIDSTGIRLGSGSTARGMDTGSTAFYAGSATPSTAPFHVTTAGVLTASGATISGSSTFSGSLSGATGTFSGGVTASSLSITGTASFSGGSMTLPNGGSITSSTVDLNQGTLANLTVDGTLTLGSGGKVVDADGSFWDQSGIVLKSAGSYGDSLKWQVGGSDAGTIYASAGNLTMAQGTQFAVGASLSLNSTNWSLFDAGASGGMRSNSGHIQANNRIYPGNGSFQLTGYLVWDGANVQAAGADFYVTNYLKIAQTGSTGSGALPNPTNWAAFKDSSSNTRYFPTYSAPNSWTA